MAWLCAGYVLAMCGRWRFLVMADVLVILYVGYVLVQVLMVVWRGCAGDALVVCW